MVCYPDALDIFLCEELQIVSFTYSRKSHSIPLLERPLCKCHDSGHKFLPKTVRPLWRSLIPQEALHRWRGLRHRVVPWCVVHPVCVLSRYRSVSSRSLSQECLCPVHASGCEAGVDLWSEGASPLDLSQRSTVFVAKIVQGTTPADGPME